uniref:Uncharacterized protein n=1 Tax=Nelumbo nucifera TaxID=4432 RepID=A0A822YD17_NELNU|nr:TPA_asm: hypothetical protein HUJ06_010875 [Nelumbo nucifera]
MALFSRRSNTRLNCVFVVFLLLAAMAWPGRCTRVIKSRILERTLESQLPRGLVPPSGPSPCHNKYGVLTDVDHPQLSHPTDYLICDQP